MPSCARLRPVALVSSFLFAVTGCTAQESSAGSERSGGAPTSAVESAPQPPDETASRPVPAPAPGPRVGQCRALSARDIAAPSDDTPPLGCGKRHTAQTFAVGRIPRDVIGQPSRPDTEAVAAYVTPRCQRRFQRWVGGDRATRLLSRLHSVWFLPTDHDLALGARWYRCDAIAYARADEPAGLPRDVGGALSETGALDRFGVCSQGSPERSSSVLVMCGAERHDWRAFTVMSLRPGRGDAYPDRQALTQARRECRSASRIELGYPLKWRFGWQPPSRRVWRAGTRHGLCWVPAR